MKNFMDAGHFRMAAEDYLLFLDKGYPQKSVLKIVGDRFALTREQRQILFRGLCSTDLAMVREKKIGKPVEGDRILVDTYNVLFTISNYFLGKQLFISNDGFLRDVGEMRGRIKNKEMFTRAEKLLIETMKAWGKIEFMLYLDDPVPFSGRFAIKLSKTMAEEEIEGDAITVQSADYPLKNEASTAICTSDSAVIDKYKGRIIDLPRFILEKFFKPEFPSFLSFK